MSSASNKTDPQQVPCKKRNSSRRRYLLTYSQVNLQKFTFSNVVLKAFEKYNKSEASVTKWEVGLEDHSSGGKHFPMTLKLSSTCR